MCIKCENGLPYAVIQFTGELVLLSVFSKRVLQ